VIQTLPYRHARASRHKRQGLSRTSPIIKARHCQTNVAPTPLEFLLSGAVGCYAAVFAFYAAKLGVSYDSLEAVARTNMDVRGHMMADAPSSGFQQVTIELNVVSDAPAEALREVERLALQGCPGLNTLREPVPVETRLHVRPTSQAAA
jgi:uncharacterized OsmC-like protein